MIELNKVDFEKMNGIIPTIIQERDGTVLSLVYSSKESLNKSIQTNKVYTYSRSRKGVYQKGATSKNTQEILEIKSDCDNDSLLFIVKQNGAVACHKGDYSCFKTEKEFNLQELYDKIESRIRDAPSTSYTKKLLEDDLLLKRKLLEEAAEVVTVKNKEELIWECADLLYFLFVTMAKNGVSMKDIEKENERRDKEVKE